MESAGGLSSWIVPSWTVSRVAARAYEALDDVSNERDAHEGRTRWCCSDRLGKSTCLRGTANSSHNRSI